MSRNRYHWISAADSCQLWDDNHTAIYRFSGLQNHVSDVAWSLDNKRIAVVQKECSEIVMAKLSVGAAPVQSTTTIPEGQPTAVGYSGDSLIVGTNIGTVLLWDQTKHKLIRKYAGTDKTSVRKIQSNTSIIAAGHAGGSVFVYGLKTGQSTGHYNIENSMSLRDLKISSVKTSLLAAAFDSGTVAAWNTVSKASNTPIVEFANVHQSPATCLALSPITDMLMVSGGLDKNIILYDCPKKKIIKKIEADAPITSIDFVPDGTALMVGTNRGKVLVYDLRSVSIPVHTIPAHASAVSRLACRSKSQNMGQMDALNNKVPSKVAVSTASTGDVQPSKMVSPRFIENATPAVSSVPSRVPISLMTCLSDRRRSSSHGSIDSSIGEAHRIPKFPSLDSVNASRELEPHKNSSLFSPLKGEASETFSSPCLANSPIMMYKIPQYPGPTQQETKPSVTDDTSILDVRNENNKAPVSPISSSVTSPVATREESVQESSQKGEASEKVDPPAPSGDFQAEFIRRIVRDVEDNLREVLRCRFGDLIVQSTQQFLTIQTELEQLKQQVQEKAYLEEEVRRLRAEVNHLRNLY